jgi:hypothetical protein
MLKLVIGSGSSQMKVRCPSKLKEVREDLTDYPTSKHGSTFHYLDGDAKGLIGREFKTGELAYNADPHGHIKFSDKAEYKVEYALHSLLGALGTLGFRPVWNLHLVASIHNSKLFSDQLATALQGNHVVSFNGGLQSIVNVTVSLIVPEGAGSYAYCRAEGLIDHTRHAISIDFGTGTIIPTVFAPGGIIEHREVLSVGGCIDLLEAIASDRAIQMFEGGRTGDIELIRQGIESRSFQYGSTAVNFQSAYERELLPWLKARFSLALKATRPWLKLSRSFVVFGGGAQLPSLASIVAKYGYTTVAEGSWANAIGLQRIAEGRLQRGK